MSPSAGSIARRAVRATAARVAERAHDLAPVRRTAQRIPEGQGPPAPHAFAGFGDGSWVVPPARVQGAGRIAMGSGVVVLEFSSLWVLGDADGPPLLTIGDGTRLARFNAITCSVGITIGDHVSSSDSATIVDTWTEVDGDTESSVRPEAAPVVIGSGAYLGCNSTVCPGVTVGRGAYVGEGAVVVDDVPEHTVVYGNPAVLVRRFDRASGTWLDVAR